MTPVLAPRAEVADATRPLRVLCVSHTAVSRIGGRLRYGPLLGRADLEIHVVAPDRWHERGRWQPVDPPHAGDVAVHLSSIRWPRAGPAAWHLHHYTDLARIMRRVGPQVIHLWQEPWSLVTLQAISLRNRLFPGVPVVLEVDQNILRRLPPPFERMRRSALRQAGFVLTRSADARRVVQACGYTGPSALIGYGVDPTVFRPAEREAARARSGVKNFTVGYVGRLIAEKGLDDLLDAAALAETPVTVAIMGEGPYRQTLLRRASALGLASRVRWQPWGPPHAVAQFMGGLDVLALLTRTTGQVREQFGRVVIEAQACGTPVIGSSCGAIPDVVGGGGWIVPERDPVAVAGLLDRLARDPATLEAARREGQRQVAERWGLANVAETLASAWRSAADA